MPWHPPIPAGLATSPEVRGLKYKMALHLLLHCYDNVQRDGSFVLNVKEAAVELEEPYGTVRRWWKELREGVFFKKYIDLGKGGFRVWFEEQWIDWHVMRENVQRSPMIAEPPDTLPQDTAERSPVSVEDPSIDSSMTFERSPVSVERSAYKEDQHVHESCLSKGYGNHDNADLPPPPKKSPLFDSLIKVCNLTTALLTGEKLEELNQTYQQLYAGGITSEQLDLFPDWWQNPALNWLARKAAERRRRLDPPSPKQVLKAWPQYTAQPPARASPAARPVAPYAADALDTKELAKRMQSLRNNGAIHHDDTSGSTKQS